jgi:serine/threonine-protein kinase
MQLRAETQRPQAEPVPSTTRPTTGRPAAVKPTPKPSATPTQAATPSDQAAALRTLAGLLRAEDANGRTERALRSAARDLDRAADSLAAGDTQAAAKQVRDAMGRLADARQDGRWQPSPQVVALFQQLGVQPNPDAGGHHQD